MIEIVASLLLLTALAPVQNDDATPPAPDSPYPVTLVDGSPSQEEWQTLADEWEAAFRRWAQDRSRSSSDAEEVPSPNHAFGPRFEALAERGDGRAILWLLRNREVRDEARGAWRQVDFDRLRAAGDVPWAGEAVLELAQSPGDLDPEKLVACFRWLSQPERAAVPRPLVLLAWSQLVRATDRRLAEELCLRAAALDALGIDLAEGEAFPEEERNELGRALLERVQHEHEAWFQRAFYEGDDGTYYPHAEFPPDPGETWEPAIEGLAEAGVLAARVHVLFEGSARSAEEISRRKAHLEALSSAALEPETLKELGQNLKVLMREMGPEFVEPRVQAIVASAPEELRATLFFGLGDGLCSSATDDAMRERGLAHLRTVLERWPTSWEGKRAAGRIFRYSNLVVGKPVPDFEAEDVDGNAFRLSDYAGKVTVIDFWGFW